ncbi:hypothetical protein [Aurantimonas sp. HBX-1]|uniref:hypothetical protein n=1 Tax=Aurantimonas sp. HBX-1 TaxID=2906072 RepID=UPI001F20A024|nr:hypothetical protein [Aurantimonas sp. HBX-1]UIJ72282.1 hypothetical protein LXB15_01025 [Aurantimonas sp. HBX-1]
MFIILSMIGFFLVLEAMRYPFTETNLLMLGLQSSTTADVSANYQKVTALIVCAGFLGAYVWSTKYLILRVANLDLTPIDFLQVSAHIILTILIAGILRHFEGSALEFAASGALLLAFLFGLFPGLGVATLWDRLPGRLKSKGAISQYREIARDFPLDLLDGIDSSKKFRLESYEITDVQIMATANPVQLFVSTPYNLALILDWIAQAQLLVILGPEKFLEARAMCIRNIHDFLDAAETVGGRAYIMPLLSTSPMSDQIIKERIISISSGIHVRFLREICFALSNIERRAFPYQISDNRNDAKDESVKREEDAA